MNIAIRYYTKTGNTKKLAESISNVINVPAEDLSHPLTDDVDILFMGSSIYGDSVDPSVIMFLNDIKVNVGMIYNFGTSGVSKSIFNQVNQIANLNGFKVSEKNFQCPGAFVGINRDRPNNSDLEDVSNFALDVINDF